MSWRRCAANWDRSADTLQWSKDGKTLYATAGDVGQTRLFAIDARNGSVMPLTGEGHVSAFGQTPSGFVMAVEHDFDQHGFRSAQLCLVEPRAIAGDEALGLQPAGALPGGAG